MENVARRRGFRFLNNRRFDADNAACALCLAGCEGVAVRSQRNVALRVVSLITAIGRQQNR